MTLKYDIKYIENKIKSTIKQNKNSNKEQMDKWMNENKIDRQMDEGMKAWHEQMMLDEKLEQVHGCAIESRVTRRTDGRIDRWIDAQTNELKLNRGANASISDTEFRWVQKFWGVPFGWCPCSHWRLVWCSPCRRRKWSAGKWVGRNFPWASTGRLPEYQSIDKWINQLISQSINHPTNHSIRLMRGKLNTLTV